MRLVVIISVLFVSFASVCSAETTLPLIEGFDKEKLQNATSNIISKVTQTPLESIAVICSKGKEAFASWITHELEKQGIEYRLLRISDTSELNLSAIKSSINDKTGSLGLIILSNVEDALFIFENVGHPVTGLKISDKQYYWDMLMPLPGLIRLMSADQDELEQFRKALLAEITGAEKINVTTEQGTDIHIETRSWIVSDGEIFATVDEQKSNGTVFVDGCAYYGPPEKPFLLRIENGRVNNLSEMDETDKQQRWVHNDLTKDANAHVLAELGIGTSINSKWNSQMMESEQARGTVHFGFGSNTMFEGGQNESSQHTDYIILKPTIVVDGRCICKDGVYQLR
ncbi:hypothetical protein ACFL1R_07815 [Candidatus Latescibacterota bacterium]